MLSRKSPSRTDTRLAGDIDRLESNERIFTISEPSPVILPQQVASDAVVFYGEVVSVLPGWHAAVVKRIVGVDVFDPTNWKFATTLDCVFMLRNQWVEAGALVRYEFASFPGEEVTGDYREPFGVIK